MDAFWKTIADYNAATWPVQSLLSAIGLVLLILLYLRPTPLVRAVMKGYMALLNFWIAGVYYLVFGQARDYNNSQAIFWGVMGCIWIYDLAVRNPSLDRTGRNRFALVLFVMPLLYPLLSLALGREFPAMTSPVMPCSVALFTIGLMLAFSQRLNIVLAMLLCHWAFTGLSKVYFYNIPEDFLLACTVTPALYILFKDYIRSIEGQPSKPSPRTLNALLLVLCGLIGVFFTATLLHQLGVFAGIY